MTENSSTPEKKTKSQFQTAMNYATAILFLVLILTPFALLVTTGEDKVVLEGEKQYTAPAFTVSDFVSSEFQSNFELWFSTSYPMRGKFVTTYRQIQFDTSNIGFDISTAFLPTEPDNYHADNTDSSDSVESTSQTDTVADTTTDTTVETPAYSDFNEPYVDINKRLYNREAVELTGYKGTDQVVIGKSGYLYENGYINEYYGLSPKYRDCTDEYLAERVEKLAYIQKRLKEMGKEFAFIITPSKASEYARFIPDWYMRRYTMPENYVRPVERLIPMLEDAGIHYLRCSTYYDEIGLDETFPLTGIHWNKIAAYEAARKMVDMYEELRGTTVRNITATKIIKSSQISGFGSNDADIFGIAYSGVNSKDAIRDDLYYWPEIAIEDESVDRTFSLFLQGGSFSWDLKYYYEQYGLIERLSQFNYNQWQGDSSTDPLRGGNAAWEKALLGIDYVILECNEQYVCMMGTDPPRWGAADREALPENSADVYESLYNYLKSTEKK